MSGEGEVGPGDLGEGAETLVWFFVLLLFLCFPPMREEDVRLSFRLAGGCVCVAGTDRVCAGHAPFSIL